MCFYREGNRSEFMYQHATDASTLTLASCHTHCSFSYISLSFHLISTHQPWTSRLEETFTLCPPWHQNNTEQLSRSLMEGNAEILISHFCAFLQKDISIRIAACQYSNINIMSYLQHFLIHVSPFIWSAHIRPEQVDLGRHSLSAHRDTRITLSSYLTALWRAMQKT